ncbi:MAG: hypothetical protein ABL997_20410 [Planctomycetota bacterium]
MTNAARLLAAAEAAALLALVWMQWIGVGHHKDLHPWDELHYYWAGVDLLAGVLPALEWAPLYSLAYAALSLLPIDGHVPDTMCSLCAFAAPLALWWALRCIVPSPIAVAAAAWFLTSPVALYSRPEGPSVLPSVYVFSAVFAFLAVGALARNRLWLAFALLVVVSSIRAEALPWLLAVTVVAATSRSLRDRRGAAMAMVVIALCLTALSLLHPGYRDRSWLAFQQSYGRDACLSDLAEEWVRLDGKVDPARAQQLPHLLDAAFHDPWPYVERDFEGASSVLSAMMANPQAFFAKVEANLLQLPTTLGYAWRTTLLPPDWSVRCLCVLVLIALVGWWRERFRRRIDGDGARRLLPRLLWTSPLVLAIPLCVSSRPELALPTIPLVAWFVGRGVALVVPSLWQRRSVAIATIALVLGLALAVPGPFRGPAEPMQYRDGVTLLREQLPRHEVRLMSTFWAPLLRLIPRSDVISLELRACGQETLASCLAAGDANAVLVTPQFEHESARFPDGLAPLHAEPWRLVAQRGDCRLYTR